MTVQNYMPYSEYAARYPMHNHSSYVVTPVITNDHPTSADRQNYVDHTYLSGDYLT